MAVSIGMTTKLVRCRWPGYRFLLADFILNAVLMLGKSRLKV